MCQLHARNESDKPNRIPLFCLLHSHRFSTARLNWTAEAYAPNQFACCSCLSHSGQSTSGASFHLFDAVHGDSGDDRAVISSEKTAKETGWKLL